MTSNLPRKVEMNTSHIINASKVELSEIQLKTAETILHNACDLGPEEIFNISSEQVHVEAMLELAPVLTVVKKLLTPFDFKVVYIIKDYTPGMDDKEMVKQVFHISRMTKKPISVPKPSPKPKTKP